MRDAHIHLVLEPYYAACLDEFVRFVPDGGDALSKLKKTQFIVDASVHDTPRHFAACRDDGRLIMAAPELAALDVEQVVAILTHELGHAADFVYPGHFWVEQQGRPAVWDPPEGRGAARQHRRWQERTPHEIEITADAIGLLVTGAVIRYAGPCLVQTFGRGVPRPETLR